MESGPLALSNRLTGELQITILTAPAARVV